MIDDHPELQGQRPVSQKLVLPAYPDEHYQPSAYTQRVFVHPDQLRSQIPPTSGNPFYKLAALWRSDPAYRVLMVAAVMVFVAGIVFATFLVNTFAQSTTSTPPATSVRGSIAAAPTSTTPTNKPPVFPTPSGGQGSTKSSMPPASSPVGLPTSTPSDPNQQSQNQNPQLQITDYPQQVQNNSDVQITVDANQPGVSVRLQISYDGSPLTTTTVPQTTGGDGTVTIDWQVTAVAFSRSNLVARITAYATDQNGQQLSSQTVSVQVSNRFNI